MTETDRLVLIVFAIPLAFLLLAVVAKVWEKRLVWPYVEADASTAGTPYMAKTAISAQALGFTLQRVCRDGKGRIYRIRYELWLSQERDVLLLLGGGSLAGMPVNGSWLFTRLSNGRCLATLDDEKASEHDLADLVQEAVFVGVPLEALLAAHRKRVASAEAPAIPYSDPVSDHREMLSRRIHTLVQRGYAGYWGEAGEGWRYTAKGALVGTFAAYWAGLRRALWSKATGRP